MAMKALRTKANQTTRVGGNIRFFRELLGMSQEKLGQAAGAERSYVGKIERGKNNPTVSKIEAIAQALGIPACLLFYHEPDSESSDKTTRAYSYEAFQNLIGKREITDDMDTDFDTENREATFVVTVKDGEAYWQPLTASTATKLMAAALQTINEQIGDDTPAAGTIAHTDITPTISKERRGYSGEEGKEAIS